MKHVLIKGQGWKIELIRIPMKQVRTLTGFKKKEGKESDENLRVWLRNLGEALYNPSYWKLRDNRMILYHGNHRVRALEALDFNFIYVYLEIGEAPPLDRSQSLQLTVNDRYPVLNERYVCCSKCGEQAKWVSKNNCTIPMTYQCLKCGYTETVSPIYPEEM